MKRIPTALDLSALPGELRTLCENAPVFDSSCSKEAQVWLVQKEGGLYLKKAAGGSLAREAKMDAFFAEKGLGPQVLFYREGKEKESSDWLLTKAAGGEDCTHALYVNDPKRLAETMGTLLRSLHEQDGCGCPCLDVRTDCLETVRTNYESGRFDMTLFRERCTFATPQEAFAGAVRNASALEKNTLLHGDYCLPNIMLENWDFRAFIDLGNGGLGDRHADLFWGAWTLNFNLHTDAYRDRFFDAYGRDKVEEEKLRLIEAMEIFL